MTPHRAERRTRQRRACVRQAPMRSLRPTGRCRVGDRARPTNRTKDSPKGRQPGCWSQTWPGHPLTRWPIRSPKWWIIQRPTQSSLPVWGAIGRHLKACRGGRVSIGKTSDMAHQMSGDELDRFLSAGTRTGKLATVRADGSPHVAPIWFVLHQNDLVFMTGADTVKGKAMVRDPRVALLVDDERPPFAFATSSRASSRYPVISTRSSRSRSPSPVATWVTNLPNSTAGGMQLKGSCFLRLRRVRVTAVAEIAD